MLEGQNIYLRLPNKGDATTILLWENNPENWRYSDMEKPYTLFEIMSYLEDAHDVLANLQIRFMIIHKESEQPLGTIDLFEINFKNKRAEIGILIADKINREKGFAKEALLLIEKYTKNKLKLDQLYCTIHSDNTPSISLFESASYIKTGEKKNWYIWEDKKIDAYFYQKFISN